MRPNFVSTGKKTWLKSDEKLRNVKISKNSSYRSPSNSKGILNLLDLTAMV